MFGHLGRAQFGISPGDSQRQDQLIGEPGIHRTVAGEERGDSIGRFVGHLLGGLSPRAQRAIAALRMLAFGEQQQKRARRGRENLGDFEGDSPRQPRGPLARPALLPYRDPAIQSANTRNSANPDERAALGQVEWNWPSWMLRSLVKLWTVALLQVWVAKFVEPAATPELHRCSAISNPELWKLRTWSSVTPAPGNR